jgi:phosphopantothenate synthetase
VFLNPLKEAAAKKKPIIEEHQIRALFSDIEIIHQFNKNLLADLEPIVEKWSPKQCLGKIFLKIVILYSIQADTLDGLSQNISRIRSKL